MRNILLAMLVFVALSCEKETNNSTTDTNVLAKIKSPQLIAASNIMSFQFLKQIDSATSGHNAFISSLSVQQALSMTLNGAKGQTYKAIAKTLGFENISQNEINEYNKSLIEALIKADPKVIMEVANSIWPKEGYNIEQSFIQTNRDFYNADVKVCDFSDPQTLNLINDWCAEKTHDKIKNALDKIPSEAVMYLINALYFKGNWKYEFDKNGTHIVDFYKADGTAVSHEQMSLEATLDYYKEDDFSVIALPYGDGSFRMLVVLPEKDKNLSQIVEQLNPNRWKQIVSQLQPKKVVVKFPRFRFEFSSELSKILSQMGMGIAFNESADFKGISAESVNISRVIHKTFIEVNETGTEAAAVTIVEIKYTSMPPVEQKTFFIADHPFLYFIEEESTGAVVFSGIMNNPKEEKYELK